MSQRSEMRRQVRAALIEIDDLIPVPWNMELLIDRIARRRRPTDPAVAGGDPAGGLGAVRRVVGRTRGRHHLL